MARCCKKPFCIKWRPNIFGKLRKKHDGDNFPGSCFDYIGQKFSFCGFHYFFNRSQCVFFTFLFVIENISFAQLNKTVLIHFFIESVAWLSSNSVLMFWIIIILLLRVKKFNVYGSSTIQTTLMLILWLYGSRSLKQILQQNATSLNDIDKLRSFVAFHKKN